MFLAPVPWRMKLKNAAASGCRSSECFELSDQPENVGAGSSAEVDRRLKARADCWPFGLAEKLATVVVCQVDTPGSRGFAIGHSGDRRGDGNRDAARTAIRPAFHCSHLSSLEPCLAARSASCDTRGGAVRLLWRKAGLEFWGRREKILFEPTLIARPGAIRHVRRITLPGGVILASGVRGYALRI